MQVITKHKQTGTVKTIEAKTYGLCIKALNKFIRSVYAGVYYESAEIMFEQEYSYVVIGTPDIPLATALLAG